MNKITTFGWLLCAVLGGASIASAAQSWDVAQLMATLAQAPSHESRFTEKKTLSILKEPAESSGILSYRRPDRLEKHVLQPKDEAVIVEGDEITWKDAAGRSRSMRLRSNATLAALAESMRATLAGDLPTLQKYFSVKLEGNEKQWALALTPIDDGMLRRVKNLRIAGSTNQVDTVDVLEANGDRSLMTLQHE